MKLVKTYDMWGQNEPLDELVNLEGKKSQKNTFKIWPIFIILNLDAPRDRLRPTRQDTPYLVHF
jgi:hypothetical protein